MPTSPARVDHKPASAGQVRALQARVEAFEQLLTEHTRRPTTLEQPRSKLGRSDRDALEAILPAIVGVFGSEIFLAAEVVHNDAPGMRLVCAGWNARRLGKLLKRAIGVPVDGLLVEARGKEAGASLWKVVGLVPEFVPPVTPVQPSAVPFRGAD